MKNYSIVCYLEGEAHNKVRAIQNELFKLTGSRKCLDAWQPHITLGSGIVVSPEKQAEVDEAFDLLAQNIDSFYLTLHGFGGTTEWKGAREGITTPYVLWINPVMNDDLFATFNRIAEDISSHYETFYPRIMEYVPHVTVAYGDLTKEGYEKGEEYLGSLNFDDTISISHVALVENFPDKDIEYKRFYLKK